VTYRVGQRREEKSPEVDRIIILDLVEAVPLLALTDLVLVEPYKPGPHGSQSVCQAQRSHVLENGDDALLRFSRPRALGRFRSTSPEAQVQPRNTSSTLGRGLACCRLCCARAGQEGSHGGPFAVGALGRVW
jgi:hypothetical protein